MKSHNLMWKQNCKEKTFLINLTQQRIHINQINKGTIQRNEQNVCCYIHFLNSLFKYCKFTRTIRCDSQTILVVSVFFPAFISSRISLASFVLVLFQCNISCVADETHLTGTLGFNTVKVWPPHPLASVTLSSVQFSRVSFNHDLSDIFFGLLETAAVKYIR